jgi:hypothetical protein
MYLILYSFKQIKIRNIPRISSRCGRVVFLILRTQ